jgi:hypothetical protein
MKEKRHKPSERGITFDISQQLSESDLMFLQNFVLIWTNSALYIMNISSIVIVIMKKDNLIKSFLRKTTWIQVIYLTETTEIRENELRKFFLSYGYLEFSVISRNMIHDTRSF